jgi:pimeloyl-ACP methyl ester carboxylesterase
MRYGAILLPGIIMPANLAYEGLLREFGSDDRIVAKELAVYDGESPPNGYSLDTEIASALAVADACRFDRFHLVGYSAGGAVSAALAARRGDRLASLTLMEPAWFGNADLSEEEAEIRRRIYATVDLPPKTALATFTALHMRPGTPPPARPEGEPPPWMAKRPAGIRAVTNAFDNETLDIRALRQLDVPVLFVLGGLTNPAIYDGMVHRVRETFPDLTVETFPKRHHFDPPHRAEPERVADLLRGFWERAEASG